MKKLIYILIAVALVVACAPKEEKSAQDISREIAGEILLKDYDPVSIFNIPTTHIEKAKYGVIDMHSHDYNNADPELIDQ